MAEWNDLEITPEYRAKIDAHIEEALGALLKRTGAVIVSRAYESFWKTLVISHKGHEIVLARNDVFPNVQYVRGSIEFLLLNLDEIEGMAQDYIKSFKGHNGPFYSDINRTVTSRWPYGKYTGIASSYICDKLEGAGVRVWT